MGLVFGLIVRWLTPVPPSWRGGVLAAGLWPLPSLSSIHSTPLPLSPKQHLHLRLSQ